MINQDRWIETLSIKKNDKTEEKNVLNPNVWVDTLPQTKKITQ